MSSSATSGQSASNAPKKRAIPKVTANTILVIAQPCSRVGQRTFRNSARVLRKYATIGFSFFVFFFWSATSASTMCLHFKTPPYNWAVS